jgi:hypothetical protein
MTENRPGAPAPGLYTQPQERSTAGRSSEACEEHPRSKEHFEPTDWEGRLREAVAKTLAEKAQRKAERQELALRRMHGLAARHKAKLERIRREQP